MEFARKPRTLNDMSKWKSVEFRQIVLYTGFVFFKDCFSPENIYAYFFVGYRIFLDAKLFNTNLTYKNAEEMF